MSHQITTADLSRHESYRDFLEDVEDFPTMPPLISNLQWRRLFLEEDLESEIY